MRDEDALPVMNGDDDAHSEPTKVGDGQIALEEALRASLDAAGAADVVAQAHGGPQERATSKMAPFQLEQVLARVATPAEGRPTVPGTVPPPPAEPEVVPQNESGNASIATMVFAVVFVVLVCAVLLGR